MLLGCISSFACIENKDSGVGICQLPCKRRYPVIHDRPHLQARRPRDLRSISQRSTCVSLCVIRHPLGMCRLLQQALRAWVGHWCRAASGKLIAARHCQRLTATAVHALSHHARQRKAKYAAWRAAAQHWRCSVFRAFRRSASSTAFSVYAEFLMLSHRPYAATLSKPTCMC